MSQPSSTPRFFSGLKPFERGLSEMESLKEQLRALEEENALLHAKLGRFVRSEFTPDEEKNIRALFDRHDSDHSGTIEPSELVHIYAELGENLSKREAEETISQLSTQVPGKVGFQEFMTYWKREMASPDRYSKRFKISKTPLDPLAAIRRQKVLPFSTRESGTRDTLEYRVSLAFDGTPISFWHDVPLFATGEKSGPYNFVCEIPKWTRAKFEIATGEEGNPIKQDSKAGMLRYYKWGDMMFNYGAFPQTWEDPTHITEGTGHKGDNDPLDVVEIGVRQFRVGQVVPVKPLGVLALIDDGETDWKVIAIAVTDPLAPMLNSVEDLEQHVPGAVDAAREFFRVYKVAEGKGINQFGFDGNVQSAEFAREVIMETHEFWNKLQERSQRTV